MSLNRESKAVAQAVIGGVFWWSPLYSPLVGPFWFASEDGEGLVCDHFEVTSSIGASCCGCAGESAERCTCVFAGEFHDNGSHLCAVCGNTMGRSGWASRLIPVCLKEYTS